MAVNNKIGLFLCYLRKGDLTILQGSECFQNLSQLGVALLPGVVFP